MKNMTAIESIEKELKEDYLRVENEKNEALNKIYQLRKEEEKLNANIYFFEKYIKLLEENTNEKEPILKINEDGSKQNQFASYDCLSELDDSNIHF